MTVDGDLAIWLYGSHARGDADELSDLDILVVSEFERDETPIEELLRESLAPSVSRYSWGEIKRMADYGSLFLRHVQLEGKPIVETARTEGRLGSILSHLGPYQLASRDLKGFRIVLQDVADSLGSGDASLVFELSTLGTLFRHASILGCALSGIPCFSRNEPVARLVAHWALPRSWAVDFAPLYLFRMYADNRVPRIQTPSIDIAWLWWRRTHELINELGRRTNDID